MVKALSFLLYEELGIVHRGSYVTFPKTSAIKILQ
jgi:hypothetical protein